ncbi:sensor histidine kinase [Desulfocurvus sp. DL9XJH121]
MKRIHISPLFIIPLLVAGWVGFAAHNSLRKADLIDAYLDIKLQALQMALQDNETELIALSRPGHPHPAVFELRNRLDTLTNSKMVLALDGIPLYSSLPDFPDPAPGMGLAQVFQARDEAAKYHQLLQGAVQAGHGRTHFKWSGKQGMEYAVWTSVAIGDHLLFALLSTPENTIMHSYSAISHIGSEIAVLTASSLLYLVLMFVLLRQGREALRRSEVLELTVAERTGELTQANSSLMSALERRKQVEEALRASEEKYRLLVEHQNDVLIKADLGGRLEFVSPSYCDLIGKPEREVLGTRLEDIIHKDDRYKILDAMENLLAKQPHTIQAQVRTHTRRGVRWLSWAGKAVPDGESGELTKIVGVGRDVTDMVLAGERIANSLAEKELLLQEIHHRVKNNLQIVCSLLDMASRRLHSPLDKELFQDLHSKIEGMSLIHSQLYQSEQFDRIDMSDYAAALFRQLANMYGMDNLTPQLDTDPVLLSINQAIPCGLVLNEMLTNIFKHAFDDQGGTVRLVLRRDGDQVRLSVSDDGKGLPEDWEQRGEKTMGVKLMRNIVQFQLGGELTVRTGGGGAAFDITFPCGRS